MDAAGTASGSDRPGRVERELELLLEAGSLFGRTLDPETVYASFARMVAGLMDCDSLSVSSYDPEEGLLRCVLALDQGALLDVGEFPPIELTPDGTGIQSRVIRTGEPLLINDYGAALSSTTTVYYADREGKLHDEAPADEPVTQSSLVVPIKLEGRTRGTVQVHSTRRDAYGADDLRLLEALTSQVAVASANALLYRQLKEELEERKRLEEQLFQAQKMEAIGQLAGGIAHDFNNLLTAMIGSCELMLARPGLDDELREELAAVASAADTAAALTSQLLAFARRQSRKPVPLDVNEVVQGTALLLARLIPERVEVRLELDPELPTVECDRGQLVQVIMNLSVNARDAMPEGGTLTIETAAAELGEEEAKLRLALEPGRYAVLTVRDTGTGMDAETVEHVFEPFFTTKAPGVGTGLGLATVYGIVTQSGGDIRIESEPGRGTAVQVHLPASELPVPPPAGEEPAPAPDALAASVLLVEDNEAVRTLIHAALEGSGHSVTPTADPQEALALAERGGHFDLLLTDTVMPGMSGPELARRITESRPGVAVVLMSGYAPGTGPDGLAPTEHVFLGKPFTLGELDEAVRRALAARDPA